MTEREKRNRPATTTKKHGTTAPRSGRKGSANESVVPVDERIFMSSWFKREAVGAGLTGEDLKDAVEALRRG